jgi:hypothetical protein
MFRYCSLCSLQISTVPKLCEKSSTDPPKGATCRVERGEKSNQSSRDIKSMRKTVGCPKDERSGVYTSDLYERAYLPNDMFCMAAMRDGS